METKPRSLIFFFFNKRHLRKYLLYAWRQENNGRQVIIKPEFSGPSWIRKPVPQNSSQQCLRALTRGIATARYFVSCENTVVFFCFYHIPVEVYLACLTRWWSWKLYPQALIVTTPPCCYVTSLDFTWDMVIYLPHWCILEGNERVFPIVLSLFSQFIDSTMSII